MRLKHDQEKALKELKDYLSALTDAKKEFGEIGTSSGN
jgi:type III restriction enzyme